MINNFYKEFKVRDYLENSEGLEFNKAIDCSLGTNPFIKGKYIDPSYSKLKEKLIEVMKKDIGIQLNSENISFGPGTMGILRNLCQFIIDENDIVLGIAPQFSRFISEVKLQKGIYEYYSLKPDNNYKFIVKDFIKKINPKTKLIYIENPNNPTGQIIQLSDIEKICITAKRNDTYVLIDEAYGDYMEQKNSAIRLINKYNNLIVIRSASKVYGLPNDRIGY